ncbi:outer membrane protein assembly factor BamB family protein [Dictyobacter vulcani]|uniref:outer membrane protein assembly factor BamB family protein n=1 Tax=Dictyobacter vulcani TaxID=2607529 RepID=UPI001387007E|nr:PQQ-binding-like beta-propeller repeat protein [Dictyobacter vulcani]
MITQPQPRRSIFARTSSPIFTDICWIRSSDGTLLNAYHLPNDEMAHPGSLFGHTFYTIKDPTKSAHQLCARDLLTNSELWCKTTTITSTTLIHGIDDLIITAHEAMRRSDGALLWYSQSPLYNFQLSRYHDRRYLLTNCADSLNVSLPLCALDVLTGKVLWQSNLLKTYTRIIGSGLVIAQSSDGNHLIALHLENGQLAWKVPLVSACTPSSETYTGKPVLTATTLFCGDSWGITAVSLATGKTTLRWPYQNQGIAVYADQTSLLAVLQKSIVGDGEAKLISLNAADGRILWQSAIAAKPSLLVGNLNQGKFYFLLNKTGGLKLSALRMSDGQSLWRDTSCDNSPTSTGAQKTTDRCYWSEPIMSVRANFENSPMFAS